MTLHKLESLLTATLDALRHEGRLTGTEHIITDMRPPSDRVGPRIRYKATVIAPFYACTPTPIWALTLIHG